VVPRGGHCNSCKEYTLWGDVIRGCYRRMRSYSLTADELSDDLEVQETKSSSRRKKSVSPRLRKSSKVKETQEPSSSSTSKPRRSRKSLEVSSSPTPTILRLPSKGSKKRKQPANAVFATEGENLDLVASSEIEDNVTPMKKKRGRPRKDQAILSPGASSVSPPHPLKTSRKPKKSASSAKLKLFSKEKGSRSPAPNSGYSWRWV
jgi:structure-specific endonuclease subunit SLX1